jgi:hypothetical protein
LLIPSGREHIAQPRLERSDIRYIIFVKQLENSPSVERQSDASSPSFESTHFRPRAVAVLSPGASGGVRLPFVEIELSTPMAIECLMRNIVTADINVAAEMHFRLGRRREQD